MWRFFARDLLGQRSLFTTAFVFFVTFLGGWLSVASNAPAPAHGFFLWTLVVLLVQHAVLTSLRADRDDGTLFVVRASHHHMGLYLLVRFLSFVIFAGTLLGAAIIVGFLLNAPFLSNPWALTWALSLPSVVSLLFASTCLTLGARHAGILGPCIVLPLLLPLMMLSYLAQTLAPASAILLCTSLTLVPLSLGASVWALKD